MPETLGRKVGGGMSFAHGMAECQVYIIVELAECHVLLPPHQVHV